MIFISLRREFYITITIIIIIIIIIIFHLIF
jgi:hypothetical protein